MVIHRHIHTNWQDIQMHKEFSIVGQSNIFMTFVLQNKEMII